MPSEPLIGGAAATPVKDVTTATFMTEVVDGSFDAPVIVDFWAPWCGPCRQLGPLLEKTVRATNGAVRMVKLNIDENPEIAQQMRIQSIPAVYAFKDGRPIDGFVGALPESQVKQFVQRIGGGKGGPSPVEEAMAMAKEALQQGDHGSASAIFSQVLQREPANVEAQAGLARALIAGGDLRKARQFLDRVVERGCRSCRDRGCPGSTRILPSRPRPRWRPRASCGPGWRPTRMITKPEWNSRPHFSAAASGRPRSTNY